MKLKPIIFALVWVILMTVRCVQTDANEVTFAIFGDPAELVAYETLVAAFEAEYPEIDVVIQHVASPSAYRQRLGTQFAAGTPPDVMLINYRRMAPFVAEGGIEPLTARFEQSEALNSADFFPIALEAFQWRGELWCVPQNVSSLVVYYNKSLFEAAELPFPSEDWDRETFFEAAERLTLDLDGDGRMDQHGLGLDPNLHRLAPFFWQDGHELISDRRLTIGDPDTRQTLDWFLSLNQLTPSDVEITAESLESRWLNGSLGMMLNSRRGVPTYRTIQSFEWDVAPLPNGNGAWQGVLHSDGYCMAAGLDADRQAAAWGFIEFANSAEGQSIVAPTGRTVPSRIDVSESDAFLDPTLPPQNDQIFIETVPHLKTVPVIENWPIVEELVSEELRRMFYGSVSIEEGVSTAVERSTPYLTAE